MDSRSLNPDESDLPELKRIQPRLPLADGLRAAAEDAVSFRDRAAFRRLAERLDRGEPLEKALGRNGAMPGDLRELVREGVASGRLAPVLEEYLRSSRDARALWRSFYAGLLYPAVMISLALLVLLLFLWLTVPQFKAIFADFGVELPAITMLTITLADNILFGWLLLLMLVLAIPAGLVLHRVIPGQAFRCRLIQAIPVIGKARRMAASAEFCSRLAVLIDCRVPLERAMRILSENLRDAHLREVADRLGRRLEQGADPADFANGVPGMMPMLSSAFRWSRDPELFADGLRSLSELFGAQARVRAGQVAFLVEPFAIVAIVMAAVFVLSAIFAPLIKLLNELS
jgi:type II secretory pathway component PulF